jgi:hypothetical protein
VSDQEKREAWGAMTPERTLGEALPYEMARVRDEVMPAYAAIGPPGALALAMMRADLARATRALADGDVVAMVVAYESLRGYET